MRTSAKIVVILLCTFIVAALAQEVARIDLTAQRAAEPTMPLRWHSSRHAMVIDGRHDTPPPLTTAIVAVAPTRVELQESIGFEVTITNNSPEPFALPSSPTLTDIEPPDHATPYKYMQTQIQLVFGKGDICWEKIKRARKN